MEQPKPLTGYQSDRRTYTQDHCPASKQWIWWNLRSAWYSNGIKSYLQQVQHWTKFVHPQQWTPPLSILRFEICTQFTQACMDYTCAGGWLHPWVELFWLWFALLGWVNASIWCQCNKLVIVLSCSGVGLRCLGDGWNDIFSSPCCEHLPFVTGNTRHAISIRPDNDTVHTMFCWCVNAHPQSMEQ